MTKPIALLLFTGLVAAVLALPGKKDVRRPEPRPSDGIHPNDVFASPNCHIPDELIRPRYLATDLDKMDLKMRSFVTVDLKDRPIHEVFQALEDQVNVRFRVDAESFREQGNDFSLETLATLQVATVPLRRALQNLLTDRRLQRNDYYIEDESEIVFVSAVKGGERLVTKLFPVADLVAVRNGDSVELNENRLIDFFTSTIDPESWDEVGGPGSIRYEEVSMSYLVRQTEAAHDGIEDALRALRESHCSVPRLLTAAGGPDFNLVQQAGADIGRTEKELHTLERELAVLEKLDLDQLPMGAYGGGFFDVDSKESLPKGINGYGPERSLRTIGGLARDVARKAMRIAVQCERINTQREKRRLEEMSKPPQKSANAAVKPAKQ